MVEDIGFFEMFVIAFSETADIVMTALEWILKFLIVVVAAALPLFVVLAIIIFALSVVFSIIKAIKDKV